MDSCRPAQKPAGPSSGERVPLSAPPSPSTSKASCGPADGATAAVCSAASLSGLVAHRGACCPEQWPACAALCEAATDQRAAEQGAVGQSPAAGVTPEQTPALDGSSLPATTLLRTETEQPGLSDGTPPGAAPRRPPEEAVVRLLAPCCTLAAAAPPCQLAHSLPDVRRCRGECEHAALSAAPAPALLSPPEAAAGSDNTAGQLPATRPSVISGIRVALQSTASHASFASPLSSVGPFCRICHEGESREVLISPCRCSGSVGVVHASCIEKWLSAANKDSCEICMYKYVTERRPKPLLEWLLNPSSPEDARNLIGDVICFFLLTGLAVIAAYLCLMGASHYLSYKTQWEATGLVVLGLLISSIYCTWLVVTCRYHCRVWHDWRRTHQDVHLLEMKQRSHSAVELNNNVPPAAAAARCRACRGGSYSCAHCCAACPHHALPLDATTAVADDVFEEGTGGLCGSPLQRPTTTTAATLEAATPAK